MIKRPAAIFFLSVIFLHISECFLRSSQLSKLVIVPTAKLNAKVKEEIFFCESCGTEQIKWMGRCSSCKEWNTIKPFRQAKVTSTSLDPRSIAAMASSSPVSPVSTSRQRTSGIVSASSSSNFQSNRWIVGDEKVDSLLTPMSSIAELGNMERMKLFSDEMNRVLGGGLVKGSVVLMAGEPGVGKSTLLLQLASSMTSSNSSVVYISGEENPQQIVLRANRLGLSQDNIFLICDVDIDKALMSILTMNPDLRPSMIIVDSIQTMRTSDSTHTLGSVAQIRDSTAKVIQFAKSTGIAIILVGHVTKSGDVAGPRVLEHMVDTVLCIEGSEKTDYRMLRCDKNRFGSVAEVGVFMMTESGMEDVANPSEIFLTQDVLQRAQEGSAVVIVMEGSRPILAEIQCLVSRTYTGSSSNGQSVKISVKRTADGFPMQRMLLICAVIEKRLRLSMWSRDVYLNVVGGLRLQEPSADLAVAAAIVSSYFNVPIRPATAFIGEIGLGGELRGGKRIEQRISEAMKLGFRKIIIPQSTGFRNSSPAASKKAVSSKTSTTVPVPVTTNTNIEIIPCASLWDALVAGLLHEDVPDLLRGSHQKRKKSTPFSSEHRGENAPKWQSRNEIRSSAFDSDSDDEDTDDEYENDSDSYPNYV